MQLSLPKDELKEYVARQLELYFPDKYRFRGGDIDSAFDLALERTENCFRFINNAAYSDNNGMSFFSHLHSDQYAQFLYYLSNTLWRTSENKPVCDKLIYLNKALHGFVFSYKGKLPDIFFLTHPVGSVVGNADYSNYLVVSQNVTVNTGEGREGELCPKLGKGLYLAAGAKIIGNKTIGDRVSIGVDAVIYDQQVEDDRVVERTTEGDVLIRERRKKCCKAQQYFNIDIG
jgi:serine O-acetyltransferase